jgi:hypothetical protein
MDRIEPADPIDRIDPLEPMDRMDPLEPMLMIDPVESTAPDLLAFRMTPFSQQPPDARQARPGRVPCSWMMIPRREAPSASRRGVRGASPRKISARG